MSDDQAVKDLLEAQQAQARDREGEYQDIREARERSIGKAVSSLIQIIGDLGPCFAVSVAYTIPGPVRGEANTHLLSGWNTNEIGSAHLAQASDLCNEKHVEIQKHLDKANLETDYFSARPDYEAEMEIINNPPSPYYEAPFINEISFRVGQAVEDVLFDQKTAEQALNDAVPDVDEILNK